MRRPLVLSLAFLAVAPAAASAVAPLPLGSFDPTAPSDHFKGGLMHVKLTGDNAMQSFAFDEDAGNIYVLQTVEGAKEGGSLWVNRIDFSGRLLDHMRLDGFGHGVSMGLVRDGTRVTIFVESESKSSGGGDGFGTRAARVVYQAGARVTPSTKGVVDVTPPQAVGKSPRPTIDPVTERLVIRYSSGGGYKFLRVPVLDALRHEWGAVEELGATPSTGEARPGGGESTSQGYAFAGGTAYLYYGDNYDTVKKPGNAYIRAVTLDPARSVKGKVGFSYSLEDLAFREPEGITVQRNGGRPRLVFGFAEDPVTKNDKTQRLANFSYKEKYDLAAPVPAPVPAPAPPPPVVAPAPAPVLEVAPRRVFRGTLLRSHRIRIRVAGIDGLARVRVSAVIRGRRVTFHATSRRVTAAPTELTLRLSRAALRRLGRTRRTVSLLTTVAVAGQSKTVRARVG